MVSVVASVAGGTRVRVLGAGFMADRPDIGQARRCSGAARRWRLMHWRADRTTDALERGRRRETAGAAGETMLQRREFVAQLALATLPHAGAAQMLDDLPPPEGPVLLTVKGRIAVTNGGGAARLDRARLHALDTAELRT